MRRLALARERPLNLELSPGQQDESASGDSPSGDTPFVAPGAAAWRLAAGASGAASVDAGARGLSSSELAGIDSATKQRRAGRTSWKDVRLAVVASAAALAIFAIGTLPPLWPHGLDGHCNVELHGKLPDGSFNELCSDGSALHLGVAALGFGALLALAAVGNAAAPSALHARALKVQAVIVGEVVVSYAIMAAGQSAPVCRNSSYGDPPAGHVETGHQPCGQRYLLRNFCWYACHCAFLSLAAYIMRMRRSVLAFVLAGHTFNMVSGLCMALHVVTGMLWVHAHGTTILACTVIYAVHTWRVMRSLWRHKAELEAQRQLLAEDERDGTSSSYAYSAKAQLRNNDAASSNHRSLAASPRLAAFVGACAVFILALRFVAGALHLYTRSDKRLLLAGMVDAAIYVAAPLAIVSSEVLSDARRMTARLAAAEARDRAKRDILRFMSHELRVPLNGIVVGLDLLSSAAKPSSTISNGSAGSNGTGGSSPSHSHSASLTAPSMSADDIEAERVLQDMKTAAAAMSTLMSDFLAIESADVSCRGHCAAAGCLVYRFYRDVFVA